MENNNVVKFTLSAVCVAVLSACGSSGNSKPAVSATNNAAAKQQQAADAAAKAAAKAAADKKAAEEKAAADAAAKAAAEKKAAAEAAAKAAAEKKAAEAEAAAKVAAEEKAAKEAAARAQMVTNETGKDNVSVDAPFAKGQESNVGAKHVVLSSNAKGEFLSDFGLNTQIGKSEAEQRRIVTNDPTAMNMELHPSLDTVLVVTTKYNAGKDEKRGYLEDFDFRGNNFKNTENGVYKLNGIYLQQGTLKVGTATTADKNTRAGDATKTTTYGSGSGDVLVYQNDRVNYTDYSKKVVRADGTLNDKLNNQAPRSTANTVAEIYGHLTFPEGKETDRNLTNNRPKNTAQANLPLAANGHSKVLNNVQYGRVTSALNGYTVKDLEQGVFKEGVLDNTVVVNYGLQGAAGTEDHYLYRGVGNTTAQQLADVVKAEKGKTLTYRGHAVSYGLDNSFQDWEKAGRPNALGNQFSFVSGNHVVADVDLTKNTVKGSIYNKWFKNTAENPTVVDSKLVTFAGTLYDNGGIKGTSTYLKDKTQGVFAATLFGDKAQEMGGIVSSNNKTASKSWGAVFGANRDMTPPPAPPKPTPKPTPKPAPVPKPVEKLFDSTNSN